MRPITESEIIKGIQERNREILLKVYQMYYPGILRMIRNNSGTEEEAKDIFQDGLMIIYEKIAVERQVLKTDFGPYLHGICKNKWLMKLRRKKTGEEKINQLNFEDGDLEQEVANDLHRHEQYELYRQYFQRLGKDCQRVLRLFLDGRSLKEIAEVMDFTEQYAKKKKYTCQKKLIESIEKDTLYNELK